MPNKFDRIIQENFHGLTMSLLRKIMDIENAELIRLPRKIQRTLEREMDTLLKIMSSAGEECLLNVEWQTGNDPKMCRRMLLYHAMSGIEYNLPVKGIMIYIGKEKMNMPDSMEADNLRYSYIQIDLTELNPNTFLQSDTPEEILLAILAGKTKHEGKRQIIKEILFKLRSILNKDKQELDRRIAQLEIFGELRDVQQIILEEEQIMAITYNLKNDIRYKQGLEKGMERGLEKGLEKGVQAGHQKATIEISTKVVLNLLANTDFSNEKIADMVNVSLDFVASLRNKS